MKSQPQTCSPDTTRSGVPGPALSVSGVVVPPAAVIAGSAAGWSTVSTLLTGSLNASLISNAPLSPEAANTEIPCAAASRNAWWNAIISGRLSTPTTSGNRNASARPQLHDIVSTTLSDAAL